jgi:hypothetical protein
MAIYAKPRNEQLVHCLESNKGSFVRGIGDLPMPRARQANSKVNEQPLPTIPHINQQPLIPAFSPYEGEKENLSLVLEQSTEVDFRNMDSMGEKQFRRNHPGLLPLSAPS